MAKKERRADRKRGAPSAPAGAAPENGVGDVRSGLRTRVVAHKDVPPSSLITNPLNFRMHPDRQRDALRGSLEGLGWLKEAALVNERTGHILDGHARIEEALRRGEESVPVTFVDLSEEEEKLALAVLDPISELAERNDAALTTLLGQVAAPNPELSQMLEQMRKDLPEQKDGEGSANERMDQEVAALIVDCASLEARDALAERLRGEGFSVRRTVLAPQT